MKRTKHAENPQPKNKEIPRFPTILKTQVSKPVWWLGIEYTWRKYGLTRGPFTSEEDALSIQARNDESILKVYKGRFRVRYQRRFGAWKKVENHTTAHLWPM